MPDFGKVGSAYVELTVNDNKLTTAFKNAYTATSSFDKSLQSQINAQKAAFTQLGTIAGVALTGIGAAAVGLGAQIFKTAGEFERLRMALNTASGSAAATEVQMKRLIDLAKLPGLGFEEIARASINLQAVRFSAEEAERYIRAFGNALTSAGRGKADLAGVILALTQIESKGKVFMEEINQIAERVPQVRMAMISAFGTANTEMIQKMGLTTKDFINGIVTELEKIPKVSGGALNSLENLGDSMKRLQMTLGNTILPVVSDAINKVADITEKMTKWAEVHPDLTEAIIKLGLALGGIAGVAGPLVLLLAQLPRIIDGFALLGIGTGALTGTLISLGAAVGGAALVIGSLILALDQYSKARERAFGEGTKADKENVEKLTKSIEEHVTKIGKLQTEFSKAWSAGNREIDGSLAGLLSNIGTEHSLLQTNILRLSSMADASGTASTALDKLAEKYKTNAEVAPYFAQKVEESTKKIIGSWKDWEKSFEGMKANFLAGDKSLVDAISTTHENLNMELSKTQQKDIDARAEYIAGLDDTLVKLGTWWLDWSEGWRLYDTTRELNFKAANENMLKSAQELYPAIAGMEKQITDNLEHGIWEFEQAISELEAPIRSAMGNIQTTFEDTQEAHETFIRNVVMVQARELDSYKAQRILIEEEFQQMVAIWQQYGLDVTELEKWRSDQIRAMRINELNEYASETSKGLNAVAGAYIGFYELLHNEDTKEEDMRRRSIVRLADWVEKQRALIKDLTTIWNDVSTIISKIAGWLGGGDETGTAGAITNLATAAAGAGGGSTAGTIATAAGAGGSALGAIGGGLSKAGGAIASLPWAEIGTAALNIIPLAASAYVAYESIVPMVKGIYDMYTDTTAEKAQRADWAALLAMTEEEKAANKAIVDSINALAEGTTRYSIQNTDAWKQAEARYYAGEQANKEQAVLLAAQYANDEKALAVLGESNSYIKEIATTAGLIKTADEIEKAAITERQTLELEAGRLNISNNDYLRLIAEATAKAKYGITKEDLEALNFVQGQKVTPDYTMADLTMTEINDLINLFKKLNPQFENVSIFASDLQNVLQSKLGESLKTTADVVKLLSDMLTGHSLDDDFMIVAKAAEGLSDVLTGHSLDSDFINVGDKAEDLSFRVQALASALDAMIKGIQEHNDTLMLEAGRVLTEYAWFGSEVNASSISDWEAAFNTGMLQKRISAWEELYYKGIGTGVQGSELYNAYSDNPASINPALSRYNQGLEQSGNLYGTVNVTNQSIDTLSMLIAQSLAKQGYKLVPA